MYHSRWKNSHRESGLTYGDRLYKNNTIINFKSYLTKEKINYAKQVFDIYNEYYPEIIEEIKGFAEGQHTDFKIVFAFLVTMYIFTYNNYCSMLALTNKNCLVFARNSDFLVDIKKVSDSTFYKLNSNFSFIGNTTAMIQIEDGINEKDLACGLTFVYPTVKNYGFNAGFLIRYILEKCETTEQAVDFLNKVPIGSSQNIIIIDRFRNLAVAELNSSHKTIKINEANAVYRTNHFIEQTMLKYKYLGEDDVFSHLRYKTLNSQNYTGFNLSDIFELLKGKNGFICQYDKTKKFDTIWSSIFDIKNKVIYRCEGNPKQKKFIIDKRLKFSF